MLLNQCVGFQGERHQSGGQKMYEPVLSMGVACVIDWLHVIDYHYCVTLMQDTWDVIATRLLF